MTKRGASCRQGSLEISFNMIFSIILIIAFIGAGFYVIRGFMGVKSCAETGTFYNDLQTSITTAYRGSGTSGPFSASLPTSLKYLCIVNNNASSRGANSEMYDEVTLYNKNLVVLPTEKACSGMESFNLASIDLNEITKDNNPFCIPIENGRVTLKIEKGFYEKLVRIENA